MANEMVYIVKRMADGTDGKPIEYKKSEYEARRAFLNADGYQLATQKQIDFYYTMDEVKPVTIKKKATKKTEN